MSGERADAIPGAAWLEAFAGSLADQGMGFDIDSDATARASMFAVLRTAWAAAAPLLPGGGEAERLREECDRYGLPHSLNVLLRHIYNNHAAAVGAQRSHIESLREKLRSARPDVERAPQEDDGLKWLDAEKLSYRGGGVMHRRAPRPQGDEVETAAREGHRNATTEGEGGVRCECGWLGTLRTWPGHALDARSGADAVKLADVLARLRHMADVVQDREVAGTARTLRTAANVLETEFASGADRPEGSQT